MNKVMTLMNDLIEVISMGPFGSDIKVDNFIDDGIPVLNGLNISSIKLIETSFKYVSLEKAKALKKANAKRGDIVITHRGTVGQISYIPENSKYDNYVISQSQFRVSLKKDLVDPIYFTYYFHTDEGQKRLLSFKSHVGVPALAQATTNFRRLEFPLIPLTEQQKIAQVLSDLDAKIELNNKINAELEAMAKTLYDYWFVQFDFPDVNGKPYKTSGCKMVWNEELKRKIPEGWDDGTFGNYCKSTGGFAFKSSWWADKGLKVVKIKDIEEDNTINLNNLSSANISNDKIDDKFMAKPGNVLIAMTGATVGKFAIIPITSEPLYVNQRVGYFNLGKEPIKRLPFLINSLNQDYFREAIFTLASGAAQPNISNEQINEIQLLIPSKELIEKFNQMLSHNYSKILINQKENQELASLRDWLLPMLMNGQVSVGEVSNEYIVKDDVLGMVAEHGEEYKK